MASTTAHRTPISAVLISHNSSRYLKACLDALAFCDEILLVDSGSSDSTITIAHNADARVVNEVWRGFGSQKNFAVASAQYDWVLCIDTDEIVSTRLRDSIEQTLIYPNALAYYFARCNHFLGRDLRHGEGYPDWSLRLFHRAHAQWSLDEVHEKVVCTSVADHLDGDLLHYSAENLTQYLIKQNSYTSLAAKREHNSGHRVSFMKLILSPLLRFFKFYFLRLGFLDGWQGLVHIYIGCSNSFFKYAKMLELQSRESHSEDTV